MVFMKKPLWTMCALVALSQQPAQAMEEQEKSTKTSLSIKFEELPVEMKEETLKVAFMSEKTKTTNFRDIMKNIGIPLSLVCKDWNEIISRNSKNWICEHFNIPPQHRDVFWSLFKGRLTYKPNPNSEEDQVNLFISSFPNPLEGEFDLSKCGDTGHYLSINMGYRKVQTPANALKIEIWVLPRFLVNKELPSIAEKHHLRAVITSGHWDAARAPIGIFWTWGGENADDHMSSCDYYHMSSCDYLTTESMEDLGSENLLRKYKKSAIEDAGSLHPHGLVSPSENFTFRL